MTINATHAGETAAIIVEGLVDYRGIPVTGGTLTATVTGPAGNSVSTNPLAYDATRHLYVATFVPATAGPYKAAVQVEAPDGAKYRARGGVEVRPWP